MVSRVPVSFQGLYGRSFVRKLFNVKNYCTKYFRYEIFVIYGRIALANTTWILTWVGQCYGTLEIISNFRQSLSKLMCKNFWMCVCAAEELNILPLKIGKKSYPCYSITVAVINPSNGNDDEILPCNKNPSPCCILTWIQFCWTKILICMQLAQFLIFFLGSLKQSLVICVICIPHTHTHTHTNM